MVSFQASRYALGVGAGVVQPSPPSGAQVNIAIGKRAGFVIDLSEPGSDRREVIGGWTGVSPADSAGPVIDGETEKVKDVAER